MVAQFFDQNHWLGIFLVTLVIASLLVAAYLLVQKNDSSRPEEARLVVAAFEPLNR